MQIVRKAYASATSTEHSPRRSLEQHRRQEQEKDRTELVREAVEPIGLERERPEREQQVQGRDRQRPLDRVEHLVQPGPAEDSAGKRDKPDCRCARRRADTTSRRPRRPSPDRPGPEPASAVARHGSSSVADPMTRSAIAGASSPHRTRAGYFTPIASPANKPADDRRGVARPLLEPNPGEDRRRAERGQRDVVERGRHAVGHRRHQQDDRAGPPGAAAQARPRQRGHVGRERQAQRPTGSRGKPPARETRAPARRAAPSRADRPSRAGRASNPTAPPHQEDLGHLKVIAQGIAVGHRGQRGQRRAHDDQARAERDRQIQRRIDAAPTARSPSPHHSRTSLNHETDTELDQHGQQRSTDRPGSGTQLAERKRRQGRHAHAERQRECQRIQRVLRRLSEPVEDSFADAHRNECQERGEAQVDHESVVWLEGGEQGGSITRRDAGRPRKTARPSGPGPSGSAPTRPARSLRAIPGGGIVAVTVVARVGLFVMGREPASPRGSSPGGFGRRPPADCAGSPPRSRPCRRTRSGNGNRSPRLRINTTSCRRLQKPSCPLQLGRTEIDARQGDVEPVPELAEQLAVAAADFQDRGWPVGRQPLGDPVRTQASSLLDLLVPENNHRRRAVSNTCGDRRITIGVSRPAGCSRIAGAPCARHIRLRGTAKLSKPECGTTGRERTIRSMIPSLEDRRPARSGVYVSSGDGQGGLVASEPRVIAAWGHSNPSRVHRPTFNAAAVTRVIPKRPLAVRLGLRFGSR